MKFTERLRSAYRVLAGKRPTPKLESFVPLAGKRGSSLDPLQNLVVQPVDISSEVAAALYKSSWIARNIVDVPAEDMVREGFKVRTGEDSLDAEIEKYFERLSASSKLHDLIRAEMIFGDGVGLVLAEDGAPLEKPLPERIQTIAGVEVVDDDLLEDIEEVEDYLGNKRAQYYIINGQRVHTERILHLQMRALWGEKWGTSIYAPMLQTLKVVDSAEWAVGQVIYSLTTKVVRGNFSTISDDDWRKITSELESELNQLTTVFLGRNEEFSYVSPASGLSGVGALLEFVWQAASGASRIPRTHLLGQQAGAITGAQWDTRTYLARIAGLQEAYLADIIKKLARMALIAEDGGGLTKTQAYQVPLAVEFEPPFRQTQEERAAALLKLAQAVQALYEAGLVTDEEARGMLGLDGKPPRKEILSIGDRYEKGE